MNTIYSMLSILSGNIAHTISNKLMSIELIYVPHFKIESWPSYQRRNRVMYVDRMIPQRRAVSSRRSDLSRSLFRTAQKMPLICNFAVTQIIYNFPFTVKILTIFDPLTSLYLSDNVYCVSVRRVKVRKKKKSEDDPTYVQPFSKSTSYFEKNNSKRYVFVLCFLVVVNVCLCSPFLF